MLGRGAWTILGLVLAFLVGASTGVRPAAGEGDERTTAPRTVAIVGPHRVSTDDVVAFWFTRYRDGWVRTMEALIDERIVEHEVKRLGLVLPPGRLDEAVRDEVAARAAQLEETYGEGVKLSDEVRRGYGMDVETWKREILRPRLRVQHLLTRAVRLDTRRRERVRARVIVLPTEAKAQEVVARLGAGADFSLIALSESIDPTARSGGALPLIARGDLTIPNVEDRLFVASPGSLVGPIQVTLAGRTSWHVYKVIDRTPPWAGSREQVFGLLETDLVDQPLERAEFERWRARMRRDFTVEVFDPAGRAVLLPSAGI